MREMRFIMDQKGLSVFVMDATECLYVCVGQKGTNGKVQIRIRTRGNGGTFAGMMGEYRDVETARYALDMFLVACEHDEVFRFPSEAELEHAAIHRSHVNSRKVSHGGS